MTTGLGYPRGASFYVQHRGDAACVGCIRCRPGKWADQFAARDAVMLLGLGLIWRLLFC